MRGWVLGLAVSAALAANAAAEEAKEFTVFDMPKLMAGHSTALALYRQGDAEAAERAVRQTIAAYPEIAEPYALLAIVLASQGRHIGAVEALESAVKLGFRNVEGLLRDPAFDATRDRPELRALVALTKTLPPGEPALKPVQPAPIADGVATVTAANTAWDPARHVLVPQFAPAPQTDAPIIGPPPEGKAPDQVTRLMRLWQAKGRAAGNHGDLYDNRDRDHSNLPPGRLPQLTYVEYGPQAQARGLNYGLAGPFLFNRITIGNSSTALTQTPQWRSQARSALTQPGGAATLAAQYAANHIYVYPEHKDHDPDQGDLFPANTPYMLISQGSSGSDKPFLEALGLILAALKPEVKSFLAERGLIAPTVQMIFRRGLNPVRGQAGYMGPFAHPSAFRVQDINLVRMVRAAQGLETGSIPPALTLSVLAEAAPRPGIDFFAPGGSERLFDTPSAIARVIRGTARDRQMTVSAAATKDPNGRPLRFHWRLLRGDRSRVKIAPKGRDGAVAEITVAWHERRPVPGDPELTTDRVDIGVFADNGELLSAPGFISFLFPADQTRSYDRAGRIVSVDYAAPDRAARYTDPMLYPKRDWRDDYRYDPEGKPIGWTRSAGETQHGFTHRGEVIVEADGLGRAIIAEAVRYTSSLTPAGIVQVAWEPAGAKVRYSYDGPDDFLGKAVPVTE